MLAALLRDRAATDNVVTHVAHDLIKAFADIKFLVVPRSFLTQSRRLVLDIFNRRRRNVESFFRLARHFADNAVLNLQGGNLVIKFKVGGAFLRERNDIHRRKIFPVRRIGYTLKNFFGLSRLDAQRR